MSWTTPSAVRSQAQRLWDRGLLLACLVDGGGEAADNEELFPRRLTLNGPNSKELADRFDEVRSWIAVLDGEARFYRLEWRTINHRTLGVNTIPAEIWIDSLEDAFSLIGKHRDARRFSTIIALTRERQPELLAWLAKRPLRALELASDWEPLLDVVSWMRQHPRPDIYLRQVDVPAVHTKFIETHRAVLAELFDLVLPSTAIDPSARGVSGFCHRYGFRDKPVRVRFRFLDPHLATYFAVAPLQQQAELDITLTQEYFAQLDLPIKRIFITENEINFLAFPPVRDGIVIFGAGYGFQHLAQARWLYAVELLYWGDIDTHGFAILNQFRSIFPSTGSFLMDRQTLLAHRVHWVEESQPETGVLQHLTAEENVLYDELCHNYWGERVRLEQEKIAFSYLLEALENKI